MADVGKYYAPEDHAGGIRRLLLLGIDFVVVVVVVAIIHVAIDSGDLRGFCTAAFAWTYFVAMESWLGTLGCLLTGVKVVTLMGERPSFARMTFRLLLWAYGPFHVLVDYFWLTGDDYKQALRDKFAGTLVVRRNAEPAGEGAIRLNFYQLFGYSLVFYEVKKPT